MSSENLGFYETPDDVLKEILDAVKWHKTIEKKTPSYVNLGVKPFRMLQDIIIAQYEDSQGYTYINPTNKTKTRLSVGGLTIVLSDDPWEVSVE